MGGEANAQRVMLETANTAKGIWGKKKKEGAILVCFLLCEKTFWTQTTCAEMVRVANN